MTEYISIGPSDSFGVIDIIASCDKHNINIDKWNTRMGQMKRHFTLKATSDCEILTLSYQNILDMKSHFSIEYSELMQTCGEKYQIYKQLKIEATKIIEALIDNDDIKVKST